MPGIVPALESALKEHTFVFRHLSRRQTLVHFMTTTQAVTMLTYVTEVPRRTDLSGLGEGFKGVLIAE